MGERLDRVLEFARDPEALLAALCDLDDAVADRMQARLRRADVTHVERRPRSAPTVAAKPQGWIRRLVGYMKPHKKNAYIAFGVAIGGQLIQSLLPARAEGRDRRRDHAHTKRKGHGKPLAPWLIVDDRDGRRRPSSSPTSAASEAAASRSTCSTTCAPRSSPSCNDSTSRATTRWQTGQLVSRASSDVALVQGFLQFLPIGVANILLFIVSFAVMLWLSPLLSLVMLAVAPAAALHRDEAAHIGVPGELGRAAEGRRRRQRRRGRRHRRARREGLRAGAPRARPPHRSLAGDVRVARSSREHPGPAPARDADDPRVRSGRGARASAAGSRSTATSRSARSSRSRTYMLLHHAAGPPVRGDPHRRPARPGRRRAHLRPPRLDAGRAGRARRVRSRSRRAARCGSTT